MHWPLSTLLVSEPDLPLPPDVPASEDNDTSADPVLAQREMEKRRSPLGWIPPLRGGDFQGMRVYRPMTPPVNAGEEPPALLGIGSMSPPDYPSAWLHPCRARFRFTWQSHCSSAHAAC